MQNTDRFYIQSRHDQTKFLKKLSFTNTYPSISYVHSYNYRPNISEFPLNFSSVDSVKDYVETTLFENLQNNYVSEINYTLLNELQNLRIVNLPSFNNFSNQYVPDCENNNLNNLEQFVRKTALKWISYKIFGMNIANHYFDQSSLNTRQIGSNSLVPNNYLIEVDNHQIPNNFYNTSQNLSNLGVNYYLDHQNSIITFEDLDNLNLARICLQNTYQWKITKSAELYNLECRVSYSNPIVLNPTSNQTYQ